MAETPVPASLKDLDFDAPVPIELNELDEAVGNLDDALEVFAGDCNEYANKPTDDTQEALIVAVPVVTQRIEEAVEAMLSNIEPAAVGLSVHSMIARLNRKWVDIYNQLLGHDEIQYWPAEHIQQCIEQYLEDSDASTGIPLAIATECALTFQADLDQFIFEITSESDSNEDTLRIFIGRTALEEVWNQEDGSEVTYGYHPFRIKPAIQLHDPAFMSGDIRFTYSKPATPHRSGATNGKFLFSPSFMEEVEELERPEAIRRYVAQLFLEQLSPLGDQPVEIIFVDNSPSEEVDE